MLTFYINIQRKLTITFVICDSFIFICIYFFLKSPSLLLTRRKLTKNFNPVTDPENFTEEANHLQD